MAERAPTVPKGLKTKGARLWKETVKASDFDAAGLVLLEEACRIADRLDQLAALLAGDAATWMTLRDQRGGEDTVEVVVDSVLSEARQHAMTLKNLSAELRQIRKARGRTSGSAPAPAAKGAVDVPQLGDLTARIEQKRAATAG